MLQIQLLKNFAHSWHSYVEVRLFLTKVLPYTNRCDRTPQTPPFLLDTIDGDDSSLAWFSALSRKLPLYNESDLVIEEHYTDTHGYTEINLVPSHLLK